jgi:two-component system chemotaxis sensor kinase CheA
MPDYDKLTGLIEQAACSVNMLNPLDSDEIDSLQTTFDQIKKSIEGIADIPEELLAHASRTADDASQTIGRILTQESADAKSSIDAVSKAVETLQGFCDEIANAVESPDTQAHPTETTPEQPQTEPAPQTGIIIAADDVSLVLDFIAESGEHLENAEAGLLELENAPDDEETLNLIFRAFHTIKGTAGFLNLSEIGSLAHVSENLLDLARKGQIRVEGANSDVIFQSIDMLKKMMVSLREAAETSQPLKSEGNLPHLITKLEACAAGQQPAASEGIPTAPPAPKSDNSADSTGNPGASATTRTADDKIKVNISRLDDLINMTGELVIAQLMVAEEVNLASSADNKLARNIAHQGKIIRDLQELSMSMRMVPISGVFQKMARLVRDLSKKADKEVTFSVSGEETELDRTIVDKIADPLVHMIRNSVDHGIELPDERKKAGKNPAGKVELRAFHQAGNIVIEIQDDGRGLDKDRILKKAIANGLVSENQNLTEEEIFKLIFHAGLSTAQKVTSVSGRGVGMDVVRKNIESLRGRIDIDSTFGEGTIFTIRLPLTLAIIDGQLVKVGTDIYIVPINSIEQSIRPARKQLSSVLNSAEMVMIRGELLPLVRLHKLFGAKPTTEDPAESLLVVVEEDGKRCCLLVDELLGQQQVVIKNLGSMLGKTKGISGGAIMGDGRVRLILDIPGLIALAQT